MADDRTDPMADVFNLFAAPLAGTIRSFDQFRKGVDEFLKGVENFNRTMENLNETTERINSLLADVEEPIRAAVPQVTRTVRAADEMMQVVSGPAMAVAPGLTRLADTLSTPAFAQLPAQISQFSELLGEVSRRLGPLTQLAESAGGIFGGLRLPGTRPAAPAGAATGAPLATQPDADERSLTVEQRSIDTTDPDDELDNSAADAAAARKVTTVKKSTAKKSAPKKKSTAQKKTTAKKSAATKAAESASA